MIYIINCRASDNYEYSVIKRMPEIIDGDIFTYTALSKYCIDSNDILSIKNNLFTEFVYKNNIVIFYNDIWDNLYDLDQKYVKIIELVNEYKISHRDSKIQSILS